MAGKHAIWEACNLLAQQLLEHLGSLTEINLDTSSSFVSGDKDLIGALCYLQVESGKESNVQNMGFKFVKWQGGVEGREKKGGKKGGGEEERDPVKPP